MGVSCGCGSDYDWYYTSPSDYSLMPFTGRRKRCRSCTGFINPLDIVGKFDKSRPPLSDIEERIYGDEVWLAPFYMCEECIDLFFSLQELGYCITLNDGESMHDMAEEAAGMQ